MKDTKQTKEQLINELSKMSLHVVRLEKSEAEHKITEEALRSLNSIQSLILDNSIMGIGFVRERIFQWVNQRIPDMLGLSQSQVQGSSTRIIYSSDEDYEDAGRKIYPALNRGEWFELEIALLRADGTTLVGRIVGKALDPNLPHMGSIWILEGITDRKQAEEALKRSESRLYNIIEFLPDATFVIDLEGKVIAWNRAMEKMTGISKEDMIGQGDYAYTIPFYGERRRHLMDLIDVSDKDLETKYQYVKRKRNTLYAEVFIQALYGGKGANVFATASPLLDNQGKRVGTIQSIRDVTDYRRAEEELREAHRRLDEIIDYLPDATFVIDAGGKVITWNRAIEQMTGIKAADMLGKGNYEYALPFYGEQRPMLVDLVLKPREDIETKYVNTARRDTILEGEAYMPALRGGEVYLFGRAGVLRDSKSNIVGAIESIRDITDRKRAEEALTRSEEKFRKAFYTSPDAVNITRLEDGMYISINAGFTKVTGYTEEDIIGKTSIEHNIWDNVEDRQKLVAGLKKDGEVSNFEAAFRTKGGEIIYTLTSASMIDLNGVPHIFNISRDITDHRRLESQLRQAQKMEAIGTLAGGIAHDFNNILASMMGYTEMAVRETHQNVRQKYHDRVLQACDRAKNLVNQILDFSRRREQERKPLDIRLILKEALSLMRATLPTTIEMRQNIAREEAIVLADPTQIHQIVMNLCANAAQAMTGKSGLLDIHLSNIEIIHPAQSPYPDLPMGSYVQLSVRDTGCGIDPKIKDKIFDPFFTTKKAKEGTGLGLSVVYGIVKSYGGSIDVQSDAGQGTTFTIYLPCISSESQTEDKSREKIDLQGDERILFVDDEETLVNMTRIFFTSLGYQIIATTSSSEALELFQKSPAAFDLVITDMTMPQLTGAELSRALLKIRPELPIILCTGYSDSINMADARKLNIREFIMKPISLNDLALKVRWVFKGEDKHG